MTDEREVDATTADAPTGPAPERYDTIVAGAGVAGLTVAHDLAARGYRVLVLEAADRIGGTAAALEVPGLPVALDAGAESFATRDGAVADLLGELGLTHEIVDPNPAGARLLRPARGGEGSTAVPMPKGTVLGIPSVPLAKDVIAVLGWRGALRAHLDRLMPVLRIGRDDALGPLVRRRMGQKVLDRLVAPLAGGVYSADPELLDVGLVAPGLNGGITRAGSLSGGVAFVLEERAAGKAGPGGAVQGLRGGMHRLPALLAERARRHHARIQTGERVLAATETPTGWVVETDAGTHEASSLVVALPEREARRLLDALSPTADPAPDAPESRSTDPSIELVTLVFAPGAIQGDPRGTGVLVAADHPAVRAKAMTHATAKWAWLREAAVGHEIVRLSYGTSATAAATASLGDDAALALALDDARAIFGTELPQPVASARVRWHQGQPSATIGSRIRQQHLRDAAAAHAQLIVVGAAVAGTGLAQVVPDARRAALEIRRERFAVTGSPWTDDLADDLAEHDGPTVTEPGNASGTEAERGEA